MFVKGRLNVVMFRRDVFMVSSNDKYNPKIGSSQYPFTQMTNLNACKTECINIGCRVYFWKSSTLECYAFNGVHKFRNNDTPSSAVNDANAESECGGTAFGTETVENSVDTSVICGKKC